MKYTYLKWSRNRKVTGGAFVKPRKKRLIFKDTDE